MFSEYTAIDRHNAILLPENLELETSAPYFCAGITGKNILQGSHSVSSLISSLKRSTASIRAH